MLIIYAYLLQSESKPREPPLVINNDRLLTKPKNG